MSGSSSEIQRLKDLFDTEADCDLVSSGDYIDVHAVAGLLKMWLRELASPVLTDELQQEFLSLSELTSRSGKLQKLKILLSMLPLSNYTLLRVLMSHLVRVVQNSEKNKMTIRNVGIVFAPTLSVPALIFNLMMAEYGDLFSWSTNAEGESERSEYASHVATSMPAASLTNINHLSNNVNLNPSSGLSSQSGLELSNNNSQQQSAIDIHSGGTNSNATSNITMNSIPSAANTGGDGATPSSPSPSATAPVIRRRPSTNNADRRRTMAMSIADSDAFGREFSSYLSTIESKMLPEVVPGVEVESKGGVGDKVAEALKLGDMLDGTLRDYGGPNRKY